MFGPTSGTRVEFIHIINNLKPLYQDPDEISLIQKLIDDIPTEKIFHHHQKDCCRFTETLSPDIQTGSPVPIMDRITILVRINALHSIIVLNKFRQTLPKDDRKPIYSVVCKLRAHPGITVDTHGDLFSSTLWSIDQYFKFKILTYQQGVMYQVKEIIKKIK